MHTPYSIEIIPDEDYVFRQIHKEQFKKKDSRFPSERHFSLNEGEKGLSVNWERYCSVERNWILIGLSYRHNSTSYKDPALFHVFRINVGVLRVVQGVEDVIHDPVYNEPPLLGKPNNRSHSLIKYSNDEEYRLKLSDLADMVGNNYDKMICTPDWQFIENELGRLRTV